MPLFSPSPLTQTATPLYQPGTSPFAQLEQGLLRKLLLPAANQQILGWDLLAQGNFGQAGAPGGILSGFNTAGQQAQSQFGALTSDLPANVSAPLQEQFAQTLTETPQRLRALAPEELAAMVRQLIDPQYLSLLQPGTSTIRQGGAPSDVGTGLSAGTVLSTLAKIGSAFL